MFPNLETDGRRRKAYQQRERMLVQQFVFERYPHALKFFNVRLGDMKKLFEAKMISVENADMTKVWRKFADAIVITQEEMIIIEAKILARVEVLAQLEMYAALVPETPELKQYLPRRIRLVLVAVILDPYLIREAEKRGVEVVVYRPAWAIEYAQERLRGRVS